MAVDAQTEAHLAGRLYAVLAELQRLAEGEHRWLGRPENVKKVATQPRAHLTQHLEQAGKYLLAARNKNSGKQAAALFRSIPDLLPTGRELPSGQHDVLEHFHAGVAAQREEIARAE
ncbi:hypothetical protein AB0M42_06275 [Streptomyces sp. NPDC051784]|uniref:hypothetical protein n=1 Tax=Streptomyces sp. NPDC051784 TaxID=3155805 RepID=UPI0034163E61